LLYSHRMLRVAAVLACTLAIGCKAKRSTDSLPSDEVDNQQLLAEQSRVQKGETVGEPLRMPKVVVTATDVTINGVKIAARADLDGTSDGGLGKRVDAVFDRM